MPKLMLLLGYTLSAFCGGLYAQGKTAQPPEFEVASIRPGDGTLRGRHGGGPGTATPTLYFADNMSLFSLIVQAWQLSPDQIVSTVPLGHESYDVNARIALGASREDVPKMLQNLLADRFGLRAHFETRQRMAYEMVVSKNGLKVKASPQPDGSSDANSSHQQAGSTGWRLHPGQQGIMGSEGYKDGYNLVRITGQREPIGALATALRMKLDLPIIDHTHLDGEYDFVLEYSSDIPGARPSDFPAPAPDMFTAVETELGIELVKRTLPINVLVVDAVNKSPSPN